MRWAIAAAQHRSLRRAAETLNIRQSTLSRRLREIEGRLGMVMFERSNGGTRPTAAGLEFLDTARRILDETDAALRRLKSRSNGENGKLTIGVYASLAAGDMLATLVEHHRRFGCFEPATTAASMAIGKPEAIDDAPLAGRSAAEDGGGERFLSREEWASAQGKKASPSPLRLRRSRRSRPSVRSSQREVVARAPNSILGGRRGGGRVPLAICRARRAKENKRWRTARTAS
jgi:DNA-binding transcriptional LysR family regulator